MRDKNLKEKNQVSAVIAKIIRVLSIPPLLIGMLLVALYLYPSDVIPTLGTLMFSLLFLSGIPTLSYLVWALVPSFRKEGRKSQRKLAFVFSILGYLGGVIYALAADVSRGLTVIFFTYFVSVIILTLINKLTIFRASGHGCGVTGPLLLPAYFMNPFWILPSLVALAVVYLSSLSLKRHTLKELVAGSSAAVIAFAFCVVVF